MNHRRIRVLACAAVAVSALGLLAGCGQRGGGQAGGSSGGSDGTVKIGVLIDLSGPEATPGLGIKHTFQVLQTIINGRYPSLSMPLAADAGLPGLHGEKVQFVFADTQSNPETGANLAQKLVTSDHVAGLIGDYSTDATTAESEVAERLGVPFIAAWSTGDSLTQRGYQWFFRTSPDQSQIAQTTLSFFQYEEKQHPGLRIGMFFSTNAVYRAQVQLTQQFAARYGLQSSLVGNVSYQSDSPTLTSEVSKLMQSKPNVLYVGAYTPDAIQLMKTIRQLGLHPSAIVGEDAGFNDPAFIKAIGAQASGIISRDVWSPDVAKTKPSAGVVNGMYSKAYGGDMDGDDARAFVAGDVLADAISNAGSTDYGAIRQALTRIDIPAAQTILPWGPVKFDRQGQNTGAGSILVQYTASGVRNTIWPLSGATQKPLWPMPGS